MPLPFNFPYTRLLVALLLVALAVPAAFASTTVDAGDDFEPPTLDLNDGGQFLFWNIGGDLVAADVFATVKIAWLFDNALVSWTSFVPALGVVNFPLVDGAVLWIVSEGPQSIVVPGLEPPEPKQPETPDEPEQPVDEPLTGPPDLVGIVFDREDYGDAFEGFLQDPDLTGELDAEQYGAEFETGGAVEARGFVAAVQQAFDAPDFADAALNTAGLAPEGEFITVFTTATRWTDSDAAALDVDSFARHLFDIDVLEVDRLTRLDSLGHDAFFAITSNPGITLLTVVFSLGQYGAAATLGVSQQPDEAALAAPSDLVLDWARVLESRIAAIPNVAGPPLTLSLADFGAQFQDWVIDLRARWVDGDSAALDLDIGAAQDAEGGATLERLDDFGDGGVFGVSSSELFDVTVVGLIFSHGSYLATSIIHIAGSDAPASAISTARGFVEDWAAELDSRIAALPNPGGPPLTLSLPDYGPFTEGWLIDPLAGPIDRALVTETGGDGEFVNGFTRSYNNPDFLAVAGTFSGVTFVNSAFREWSDEARAIAEYDDALAGTKDLKLEVVPFDDLFPDGAFATEFTLDDIEVFSQIMIRVGRFTATITLSGIGVTGDLAEKVGGLLLEWAQAFADNLAAAQ